MFMFKGLSISPGFSSWIASMDDYEIERRLEEPGDPEFACLLVGLGLEVMSLSPGRAAKVRHAVQRIDRSQAEKVANSAFRCRSPQAVRELLEELEPSGPAPTPCWSIHE